MTPAVMLIPQSGGSIPVFRRNEMLRPFAPLKVTGYRVVAA